MFPTRAPRRIRLITPALVVLAYLLGIATGPLFSQAHTAQEPAEFAIFWESWNLVLDNFVDREKIDLRTMTYGAIRGMLATLEDDNHTAFFSPEEAQLQQSSLEGSFEGIGAYVAIENGLFTIVAPIHGSPAEAAGLLAGDVVLAVNGEEITGTPQWEVISRIRGPAGSTVTLTVRHPNQQESVDITIQRGRIDLESVLWVPIPGTSIVYVQITQFAADTSTELRTALTEIAARSADGEPVSGMILDLRNNPGGFLQESLRVGREFLAADSTLLHERDAQGNLRTYQVQGDGLARDIPLIVLINQGSASAAEITAGALQQNNRARLVGATTLGTGTVLRPYTLSDGSVLRLGVTHWLTPDMVLLKDKGVEPDISIVQESAVPRIDSYELSNLGEDELYQGEDRQFLSALFLLKLATRQQSNAEN